MDTVEVDGLTVAFEHPGAGPRSRAELHGGTAWVEDRPGGGSSFQVILPGPPGGPEASDT